MSVASVWVQMIAICSFCWVRTFILGRHGWIYELRTESDNMVVVITVCSDNPM